MEEYKDCNVVSHFFKDLKSLINRYSRENISNTPDFILAQYIESCLSAFDTAVKQREMWYGRDTHIANPPTETPPTIK